MKTILVSLLTFIFLSTAIGQSGNNLKYDLADLGFMEGKWKLSHEWGEMEENWSAPLGNTMICSYRCVKDGKIVFYEFIVIEQSDSVPVMKLRHFGPGNIAWEDKDKPNEYPLVSLSAEKAVFEKQDKSIRLIFQRTFPDSMLVVLESEKNGIREKEEFNYKK